MSLRFVSFLPSWVTYCDGAVPILLVAPHGGRRPADAPIRDSLKVNDLYTAELTTVLAARTGSYALINHAGDRNDLDLNRISQVRTQAPWFLDALVELLSMLVARHGSARVFFIHGWNVVQPVCDLGMGLKQKGERVVPASKVAAPTLSASFFTDAILPFRTAALAQGIDVALGRRYPAADKDNLMQVFSPRFADDLAPAIRTLAALSIQEKINAVQLELGVGLRWPGPERERFIEVFCQTLGQGASLTQREVRDFPPFSFSRPPALITAHRNGSPLALPRGPEPTRLGLHFHDPRSGLGVMGGIEFSSTARTQSGRLMLSLGGTEMVLFTGEDETTTDSGRVQVGGFVWQSEGNGLTISYHGPVMRFAHPQAFIRLEEGLAASWVESATIALHLTLPGGCDLPPLPLFLAHLRGEVRLRDRRCAIDAWGFLDMLKAEETGRLLPRRLLSLPFGPDLGVFLSWVETPTGPQSSGVIYHHGTPHLVQPEDWDLRYTFAQGRPTAFHLSLTPAQPLTLHCSGETVTAIPIVRHAPQGSALFVTFGLSRTVWQGREARGVYEFSARRQPED
jgi:hypothetical protein